MISGKELLPFNYETLPEKAGDLYPAFAVDGSQELFRCGMDIYAPQPEIPAKILRELAESCNCSFDAPCGSVVYGDNRFRAIFKGSETCTVTPDKKWNFEAVSGNCTGEIYELSGKAECLFFCNF